MNIVDGFIEYFKSGETKQKRIGLEIEHFVMKNGSPLSYNCGVADILSELSEGANEVFFENGSIIGCDMGDYTLTLEPAAQLEVSVRPLESTDEIYEVLQGFYKRTEPILEKYSAKLEIIPALSDEMLSKAELIPKKRYEYMDSYFKTSGTMGKNMMRGTTSVQVSIDYESEADFVKKFRTAYILSPIFAYLMSEDKLFRRIEIWNNTDNKRTYMPACLFSDSFGFEAYAKELLAVPPIFVGDRYTDDKTIGELAKEMLAAEDLTEHFLSMVFPDVRLKRYIEIRIADGAAPEKAIEYAEFVKTLFYTDALDEVGTRYKNITAEDIKNAKNSLFKNPERVKIEADAVVKIAENYGFKRSLL